MNGSTHLSLSRQNHSTDGFSEMYDDQSISCLYESASLFDVAHRIHIRVIRGGIGEVFTSLESFLSFLSFH